MKCEIDELHSKAMDLADDAFIARRKGLSDQANDLYNQAFEIEKQAALLLVDNFEVEPTRSVLFRSAGWLAFNADDYESAQEMVDMALQGNPPPAIKEQLEELSCAIIAVNNAKN